jgi:hypothetical protein
LPTELRCLQGIASIKDEKAKAGAMPAFASVL